MSDRIHKKRFKFEKDCTSNRLILIIKIIKTGKAFGIDGLALEHFIYANPIIHVSLSLLFNCFISHDYLARYFMKTAFLPINEKKTGYSSDKTNYKHISLVIA